MLSFKIAVRFLKSSLGQTILIILGIAIGVSVQVFIGSLISGLQKSLVDKTIGSSSQVTISTVEDGGYIANYEQYIEYIQSIPNFVSVAPVVETGAVSIKGTDSRAILVRGMDFQGSEEIYGFESKLVAGRMPQNDGEVLIGITAFQKLGLVLNGDDTFTIYMPPTTGGGNAVERTEVEVVGVFDFKVTAINDTWVIATIPAVRTILNIGDVVTAIETQVDKVFETDTNALELAALIQDDTIEVVDWKSQNESLLSGLNGQSYSSIMIQVFVTLSVILGIASVLAITVLQKSKQIGILKAMGIKNGQASFIFLSEGMILGIFGAIVGVSLGLGLSLAFTTFALNADGTPVVPLFIDPKFIALSAGIAFLSASLASLIPARRSTRISIIEVIKNG
jgi:lipoprotein-releasing system permease protein